MEIGKINGKVENAYGFINVKCNPLMLSWWVIGNTHIGSQILSVGDKMETFIAHQAKGEKMCLSYD